MLFGKILKIKVKVPKENVSSFVLAGQVIVAIKMLQAFIAFGS
jgi:hypothetical protein